MHVDCLVRPWVRLTETTTDLYVLCSILSSDILVLMFNFNFNDVDLRAPKS